MVEDEDVVDGGAGAARGALKMSRSSSISLVEGGAEIVMVGFLLNAPSPDDAAVFGLDSVDGSRDVLPFTIAILVAVAVCVALNGLDTSKDVGFGDLMPRNGIAERCLAADDESAERRDAGSAEKREEG